MTIPHPPITLFSFDEDRGDHAGARALLERRLGCTPDHGFAVLSHSNRIRLFDAIAAQATPAVALVDLQAEDRLDNEYSGHRVIEIVRRHPELHASCRPVAFTAFAYPGVVELTRRHGAYGVISKQWAQTRDVDPGAVREWLRAIAGAPPVPIEETDGFRTLGPRLEAGTEGEDEVVAWFFRDRPSIVEQPFFWDVVRYLADDLDRRSIARWVHADHPGVSEQAVERHLERMGDAVDPRYRTQGLRLEELARDLIAELPHRRAAPTNEVLLRTLHRLQELGTMTTDYRVVAAGRIDEEALSVTRRVQRALEQVRIQGGQHAHHAALLDVLRRLEPDSGGRVLHAPLIRGVHGVVDTWNAFQPGELD
ncbi:hypothetical protein [Patulibacter minatonensis]|uniref:hypothetical protein n=1 Tax=Patulibacter minatonensis TaxID=298163 RepID=UPI00047D7C02|nr:hypothetical protein [Patulibacter minatonensis]